MGDQRKIRGIYAHFPAGTRKVASFDGAGIDGETGLPFFDEKQADGGFFRNFNVPFTMDLGPPDLVQPVDAAALGRLKS
jgi:hypothetical protein